jgi:hypothetical protein
LGGRRLLPIPLFQRSLNTPQLLTVHRAIVNDEMGR